ncbi:UNVERIFIED_CONTAM: hypothetical protein PYX00_008359 [Menopon gallinae]|uniref:Rab-GAP TBC domain-containing protein n=1 Tax=Menopon gallinae TaxID=328185 RepID=A0AAW2HNF0_9NEOP
MSNINNEPTCLASLDLSEFDDYDIISDDFSKNQEGKDTGTVGSQQDDLCQPTETYADVYFEQWNELYCSDIDIQTLKKKALDGELRANRFRSICWRCLLGILHCEPKQWLMELKTHRSHYSDLWVELHKNPWNVERNPSDNPLSQEAESIWQKYFSDEELKSVIHQDVVRTFPGINFYRDKDIQDLMVRILFCYARQNPVLCYRQGMHEILAPLIFILHCDHQALLHYKSKNLVNNELMDILDPNFIEEDAYSIFKHIMNHIECSYRVKNMTTSTGYFTAQVEEEGNCENEVVVKLQYIKENILQTSDPDLNKHLNELDIPLHLFGIRWLRLLFGREFPFQELLVLWDAIFAVDNFELVNYVVVAMLTAIRSILLAGDYTTCLTNLMRYPNGVDVMFVIEYALHLMNPALYPAPAVTSFVNKPVTLITKYKNKPAQVSENTSNERFVTTWEYIRIQ